MSTVARSILQSGLASVSSTNCMRNCFTVKTTAIANTTQTADRVDRRAGTANLSWTSTNEIVHTVTVELPCTIHVIAVGKGAIAQARELTSILTEGAAAVSVVATIVGVQPHAGPADGQESHPSTAQEEASVAASSLSITRGGHPTPTVASCTGAASIAAAIARLGSTVALNIVAVSGGASAAVWGGDSRHVDEAAQVVSRLLSAGVAIDEINAVRTLADPFKGGGLAAALAATGAPTVSLIMSDVPSNDLAVIASGPTVVPTQALDARIARATEILVRTGVAETQASARRLLDRLRGDAPTWPTPDAATAAAVHNVLVCDASTALRAMEKAGAEAGLTVRSLGTGIDEPAHTLACRLVECLATPGTAVVGAGETTVLVEPGTETGKGGRNQEVALAAAVLGAWPAGVGEGKVAVGSVGTDGQDNGPAAGAVVSSSLASDDRAVDALRRHDSYTFFTTHAPASHIITGPTNTNVADIFVAVRLA